MNEALGDVIVIGSGDILRGFERALSQVTESAQLSVPNEGFWRNYSETDSLESVDSRVYSAVKVDISEWYPSCQLLMIRVLGLTEAVLCVLIVSTMHAIIKTSNALIKKKKITEKQRTTIFCEDWGTSNLSLTNW
ncbi:hypothetical protein DAPPUDRAFT_238576 [Daphnia pulex]|uniref:Uncharacterized protein n=1 Tax=Daphnia pulex TaxID=6669 RepID=E9G831_DAPPU|nr:hypothetical protein DAPPUDRAFT_238576 [Daphnia pulex]|eukprot:EFX84756.1 hypothetical protein DAPPUDRAFT_238576 [Daphnia pulex]